MLWFLKLAFTTLVLITAAICYLVTFDSLMLKSDLEPIRINIRNIKLSRPIVELHVEEIRKDCPKKDAHIYKQFTMDVSNHSTIDCSRPFVLVEGRGRLGNHICEYLTLLLMQRMYGFPAAIDPPLHKTISDVFSSVKIPIQPQSETCPTRENMEKIDRLEFLDSELRDTFTNNPDATWQDVIKNTTVNDDWPCSHAILLRNRHLIADALEFNANYTTRADEMLNEILGDERMRLVRENKTTLIGVHVRRDDMTWLLWKYYESRDYLSFCYFRSAINYYRERYQNALFVVAGTNMEWNKKNLIGSDIVYADRQSEYQPILDLVILAQCDHQIISFGTFSFSSMYLGSGTSVHSFVVDGKLLTFMEKALICSNNSNIVAVPDC